MSQNRKDIALSILACAIVGIPLYYLESTRLLNFNIDWKIAFFPATRLLLHGQNPYWIPTVHNPIWTFAALVPFVLLGEALGGALLFFFSLFTYAFVALRLHSKPLAIVAFLLSPLIFYNLFLGNIDALVLWGILLPPPIGLFLLAMKPQIGIGAAIYMGIGAWQAGGWRKLLTTTAPVLVSLAISFLFFGNRLFGTSENVVSAYWNLSLFPWSVPIGAALLGVAVRRHILPLSASASPFLAPYLSLGSWSIALLGLLQNNLLMVAAVFGLWLLWALRAILR